MELLEFLYWEGQECACTRLANWTNFNAVCLVDSVLRVSYYGFRSLIPEYSFLLWTLSCHVGSNPHTPEDSLIESYVLWPWHCWRLTRLRKHHWAAEGIRLHTSLHLTISWTLLSQTPPWTGITISILPSLLQTHALICAQSYVFWRSKALANSAWSRLPKIGHSHFITTQA